MSGHLRILSKILSMHFMHCIYQSIKCQNAEIPKTSNAKNYVIHYLSAKVRDIRF